MKYLKVATTLALLIAFMVAGLTVTAFAKNAKSVNNRDIGKDRDLVLKAKIRPEARLRSGKVLPKAVLDPSRGKKVEPVSNLQTADGSQSMNWTSEPMVDRKSLATAVAKNSPRFVNGTGLSGEYYVGVTPDPSLGHPFYPHRDFATLHDAVNTLTFLGVSGPVTFLLTDASYTETSPVVIGWITGTSATNTVCIRPDSNVASTILTFTDDPTARGGLFLQYSHYVTINGCPKNAVDTSTQAMTIKFASNVLPGGYATPPVDAPLRFKDGAQFCTVKNVKFQSAVDASTGGACITFTNSLQFTSKYDPDAPTIFLLYNHDITIQNCQFTHALCGVYAIGAKAGYVYNPVTTGSTNTTANTKYWDQKITITKSQFGSLWGDPLIQYGIRADNVTLFNVLNNHIDGIYLTAPYGKLSELEYTGGIRVMGLTNNIEGNIINNVVTNWPAGNYMSSAYGIRIGGPAGESTHPWGSRKSSLTGYDGSGYYWLYAGGGGVGVPTKNRVVNNVVTGIVSNTPAMSTFDPMLDYYYSFDTPFFGEVGIQAYSDTQDSICFNSVYLTGTSAAGAMTAAFELAGNLYGGTLAFVMGNAFASDRVGSFFDIGIHFNPWDQNGGYPDFNYGYAPFTDFATKADLGCDHNDYYGSDAMGFDDWGYITPTGVLSSPGDLYNYFTTSTCDISSSSLPPYFVGPTDLHFSSTDPTPLNNAGGTYMLSIPKDVTGAIRGPIPDIGAYEGNNTAPSPVDVMVLSLKSPGKYGLPPDVSAGRIVIKALSSTHSALAGVPFTMVVKDPLGATVYNQSTTASLSTGIVTEITFPGSFIPSLPGDYTFDYTVAAPGDVNPANDALEDIVPVASSTFYVYHTTFDSPAEQVGWTGTKEFALASNVDNGKFGGDHDGGAHDYCWVTDPSGVSDLSGQTGSAYGASTINNIYSPVFDFTNAHKAVLSFWQALATEPNWDRAIMEYSIDKGATWKQLGGWADTAGINWYGGVYKNLGTDSSNFDHVYAKGYMFWPPENPGHLQGGSWTSNGDGGGDDVPLGPPDESGEPGWTKVSFDLASLPPAVSPFGKPGVRFRYSAYADGGGGYDGWAFDDFSIDSTSLSFIKTTVSGVVFDDKNANGVQDPLESALSGVKVRCVFAGTPIESTLTDVNGAYTLHMKSIGGYILTTSDDSLLYKTEDPGEIDYDGSGTAVTGADIGFYHGYVAGSVFSDKNNNDAFDAGEGGLPGFTIEIYSDSTTFAAAHLLDTVACKNDGTFYKPLPPGVYGLKCRTSNQNTVIAPYNDYRQTLPVPPKKGWGAYLRGVSGSDTAKSEGKLFGQFVKAHITVMLSSDHNGNGVIDNNETVIPVLYGYWGHFKVKRDSGGGRWGPIRYDSAGNGQSTDFTVPQLDTGKYMALKTQLPGLPYVRTTLQDTIYFNIYSGEQLDTAYYLFFFSSSIRGNVLNDPNGNGKKDVGETNAGLATFTVAVNTVPPQSIVTDATGAYRFNNIGIGTFTVTVTGKDGYTNTNPLTKTFTSIAASALSDSNFFMFKNFMIAGHAFRDLNKDNAKQDAEPWKSGIVVHLTGQSPITTLDDGAFTWSNLGPGSYTISADTPLLFQATAVPAHQTFTAVSGTDVTGLLYGYFRQADTAKYRTITADDLIAGVGSVLGNPTGKVKVPSMANLVDQLIGSIGIGRSDVAGHAYLAPAKYKDVFATVRAGKAATGFIYHTGTASGFDFTTATHRKPMTKLYKAIPPTIQNNLVIPNLLALEINVALSEGLYTTPGLGDLIYNPPTAEHSPFQNLAVSRLVDSANTLMTSWEKVDQSVYDAINTAAVRINAAFNTTFDYDAARWTTDTKVYMAGFATVYSTPYLLPNAGATPAIRHINGTPDVVPTVYALYQNYPNPFNPTTTIRFDLPISSVVSITIYNMLGQEVTQLSDHQLMDAGMVEMDFNATNFASGVYFYRVVAEGQNSDGLATGQTFTKVMKMALIK